MQIITGTVNLVYPAKSSLPYKLTEFSDSQVQIEFTRKDDDFSKCEGINICSRMEWSDLQKIICATKALRNLGVCSINLVVPYFLGARSDRQFVKGSTNYLKDIICPILNSLQFQSVVVLDPHSPILQNYIRNLVTDNIFYSEFIQYVLGTFKGLPILVSPDVGAVERIKNLSAYYNLDYVLCSKIRDPLTGKILQTTVPTESFNGKDLLIVDDICDGGATFIELAKAFKERNAGKLYLAVTHGIFSKGFDELLTWFDRIYTTDSVREHGDMQTSKRVYVFKYF